MTVAGVDHTHATDHVPPWLLALLAEPAEPVSLGQAMREVKAHPAHRWYRRLDPVQRRLVKACVDLTLAPAERSDVVCSAQGALLYKRRLVDVAAKLMALLADPGSIELVHCKWCHRPRIDGRCGKRGACRKREEDLLARAASLGKSTTQIAEEVGVSDETVRKTIERSTSNQLEVEHPAPQPAAITGKDGKKRPPKDSRPCRECGGRYTPLPAQRINCCPTDRCRSRRNRRRRAEGAYARHVDRTVEFRAELIPLYAARAAENRDLFTGEPAPPPIPVEALAGGAL